MSFHFTPNGSEDYQKYLKYIADLDMSPKEKFELLYIVNSILCHFVDHAFGVQTDQITLRSVGKMTSNAPFGDDTMGSRPESQTAHARRNGVEGESNPEGSRAP